MTLEEKIEFKDLKERVRRLSSTIAVLNNQVNTRWFTLKELPSWAQPTIKKLIKIGFLKGDSDGLSMSYQMIRLLIIFDRAGLFR